MKISKYKFDTGKDLNVVSRVTQKILNDLKDALEENNLSEIDRCLGLLFVSCRNMRNSFESYYRHPKLRIIK
jgi:hypothetical protein